jgi:hypothetical protein
MLDAIKDGNDARPASPRKEGFLEATETDVGNRMVYKLVKVCILLLNNPHMVRAKTRLNGHSNYLVKFVSSFRIEDCLALRTCINSCTCLLHATWCLTIC